MSENACQEEVNGKRQAQNEQAPLGQCVGENGVGHRPKETARLATPDNSCQTRQLLDQLPEIEREWIRRLLEGGQASETLVRHKEYMKTAAVGGGTVNVPAWMVGAPSAGGAFATENKLKRSSLESEGWIVFWLMLEAYTILMHGGFWTVRLDP